VTTISCQMMPTDSEVSFITICYFRVNKNQSITSKLACISFISISNLSISSPDFFFFSCILYKRSKLAVGKLLIKNTFKSQYNQRLVIATVFLHASRSACHCYGVYTCFTLSLLLLLSFKPWSHGPMRLNSKKQFCWVESRRAMWSLLKLSPTVFGRIFVPSARVVEFWTFQN